MKLTDKQIHDKTNVLSIDCQNSGRGLVSFGTTAIFALHYSFEDGKERVTNFTIFDYDTPICEIYFRLSSDGKPWYFCNKYDAWRYSRTTTKNTKNALELVVKAIDCKYNIQISADELFTEIDKKERYSEFN